LDINQLGAAGVREFLDRGNVWSGRGLVNSHVEAVTQANEHNAVRRQALKERGRDGAKAMARDTRKQRLGVQSVPVGVALKQDNLKGAST